MIVLRGGAAATQKFLRFKKDEQGESKKDQLNNISL
jgi:hypothetical protein